MFQTWHLFAIGTVFFGSVASLLIRSLMKDEAHDPVLFMIVFQLMLTLVVFIFALYRGFVFPFPSVLWPRMIVSAILYAAGSLCNFYASKHIEAGELTIITASGALVTILLGIFFLGNNFSIQNAVGTLLIILSILTLYAGTTMKINKGFWYALGVAFFFAVAVVNDVVIIKSYDPISFVPIMSFMPGLIIAIIYHKKLPHIKKFLQPKPIIHLAIYSLFYGIAAITFYQALFAGASISQLSPITRASIIVTVILSALFLRERTQLRRKIVSAILVSGGVLLLA